MENLLDEELLYADCLQLAEAEGIVPFHTLRTVVKLDLDEDETDASDDSEDELPYYVIEKGTILHRKDGCNILALDGTDPVVQQFFMFAKCLRLIGLHYWPLDSKIVTFLRILYQAFMISLYLLGYDVYHTVYNFDQKSSGATFLFGIWVIQALISQVFISYSRMNMMFGKFFHLYKHCKIDDRSFYDQRRRDSLIHCRNRFFFCQIFIFLTIIFFGVAHQMGYSPEIMYEGHTRAFWFETLCQFRLYIIFYSITVWNIALHTYICLSKVMFWEVKKLNRKIKMIKPASAEKMITKLEELIRLHTNMGRCVRELAKIFKVYAFLMVCTVIPATIFSMMLVLSRTSLAGWLLATPAAIFCIYGYYGVTLTPANLREEIQKLKSTLFMNRCIWVPFDERQYKVAHTLAMHIDQPDLGITLWGFAMVTKPMILTTISVMMTCLAIILELKPKQP